MTMRFFFDLRDTTATAASMIGFGDVLRDLFMAGVGLERTDCLDQADVVVVDRNKKLPSGPDHDWGKLRSGVLYLIVRQEQTATEYPSSVHRVNNLGWRDIQHLLRKHQQSSKQAVA